MKGGIEACYSSVSCACALLGALDELSQGHGIQPEQVRKDAAACGVFIYVDTLYDGSEHQHHG